MSAICGAGAVLGLLVAAGPLAPPSSQAENTEQTLRVRTRTIKLTLRPSEGQIDLLIGSTTYRYFIRSSDAAALPAATAAKLAEIQASSLIEIESVPYGDYRKVTKLTLLTGDEATVAAAEQALPKPYNGCASKKTLAARLTAREAFDLAAAEARAWRADSALNEMTTLRDAPLDAQGRSTSWSLQFFSTEGKQINSITITDGAMHCSAQPTSPLRTLEAGPDLILDTKRIYAVGQEAGGSEYTTEKFTVRASLSPDRRGGAAWYLNYEPPGETGGSKTIIVDARTGVVR